MPKLNLGGGKKWNDKISFLVDYIKNSFIKNENQKQVNILSVDTDAFTNEILSFNTYELIQNGIFFGVSWKSGENEKETYTPMVL